MLDKFSRWTGWLLPLLLVAPGVVLVARGSGGGTAVALAALAAAALGVLLHLLLRSIGTLVGQLEQPPPAPDQRLRDLEREKLLLLRSIREIDFDAGLQRLDETQAAQLAAPLRQRALEVLQQLDATRLGQPPLPIEQQIEGELRRRLSGSAALVLLLALSALASPAWAQAAGPSFPTEMLGQPLPSADLPAGVLTVRVIGDGLDQAQAGQTVELFRRAATAMESAGARKSGPDGRVRFDGLREGVSYLALLRRGAQGIPSRPFSLTAGAGVKMLLSTRSPPQPLATALAIDATATSLAAEPPPPAEGAAAAMDAGDDPHAGVAGAPPLGGTSGAATLSVAGGLARDRIEALALLGAARRPLAGAKVTLSRPGEPDLTQPTDAEGRTVFSLPRAATASKATAPATFTLQVAHEGHSYRSAALTPAQVGGKRATFVVHDRTTSRESLELAPGSHVLAQVSEGRLSCTHIIVLVNRGPRLVDLGEGGLVLPLPAGALRASLSEETERVARLDEDEPAIVLRGPLPPGQLVLQVSYELPYQGATLELRQRLPLGSARSLLALAEAPGVEISGPNLETREVRRHQGVAMQLFSLSPVARGKQLELTIRNLPHRAEWPRQLVLGLTLLIALWATVGILQGRRFAARRAARREALLDALAALERRHASGAIDATAYGTERAALIAQARLVWDAALPQAG